MRTAVLAAVALVIASHASAETIRPQDASSHVGQTVTVQGIVDEVHTSKRGNTFINMGGHYPNQAFTGFIRSQYTPEFPNVNSAQGKTAAITGKIELYKGAPQIVMQSASQLEVK
jgi:DNA/RNA endonuclease YhcR with UshA esterase domain